MGNCFCNENSNLTKFEKFCSDHKTMNEFV